MPWPCDHEEPHQHLSWRAIGGSSSTYCNAGQTDAYCLVISNGSSETRFGITCTDGTAFGKMCGGGCNTGPGFITCY